MEKQNQELKICQSCGMPMQEDQYGTEKDGSSNELYCCYCYKGGAFVQDCDMEGMVEFCAPFEVEGGRARTLEEVGKRFDVTRERIRQIEAKALRKLRHPSRSKKLKDYLE